MSLIALATSVRALVDDFNARDWAGVIARCDYHVCFKDMATSNATSDIQQSVDSLQQWISSFPDLRVTLISHHFAETVDIGELLFEGHQQGGFIVEDGKIPATGRKVSWAACVVIEKQQEKISDIRLYYDLGTILDQLATPILPPTPSIREKDLEKTAT